MEGFVLDVVIENEVDFPKLKKEHFNIKQTYILKSKSLEAATDILLKAAGYNNFSILGTAVPVELGPFYSAEDLGKGEKLYGFVLKDGLGLDARGIYTKLSKKMIGKIDERKWARGR